MGLLFTLLVVLGFALRFVAAMGAPYADRVAWGCWLAASLIWAVGR